MESRILSDSEKDGLKEICNIGSSKASSFLTERTGDTFDMDVPEANIIKSKEFLNFYTDVTEKFNNPMTLMTTLKGVDGSIIVSSSEENMKYLLSTDKNGTEFKELVEKNSVEAVKKYLNGLNDFLNLNIEINNSNTSYKYADMILYQRIKQLLKGEKDFKNVKLLITITSLYIGNDKMLDIMMVVKLDDVNKITDPLHNMLT